MASILKNAADSIELGIEDIRSQDPKRAISAIRNFYSGMLLLGKECLLSRAPGADPKILLASRHRPVSDGIGGIRFEAKGNATIDVAELEERFKDLGLPWVKGPAKTAFDILRSMRNDIEHSSHSHSRPTIEAAMGACFPIVADFFRILGKSPADVLGSSWTYMAEQDQLYRQLQVECRATLAGMPWFNHLEKDNLPACASCGLTLLRQSNADNDNPEMIEGGCHGCGTSLDAADFVELVVAEVFAGDAHLAAKDGGDPPYVECRKCQREAFVIEIDDPVCFFCGHGSEATCRSCVEVIHARNSSPMGGELCLSCWQDTYMDQ